MKTKVIFRTFPREGDTVALFPELPATHQGHDCLSYAHLGQHGAASPALTRDTRRATPEEIAPLRRELETIGYDLDIRERMTPAMSRARLRTACAYCEEVAP